MTPAQRAALLFNPALDDSFEDWDRIRARTAAVIEAAILDEREACAELAREIAHSNVTKYYTGHEIANAIRARTDTPRTTP